MIFRQAPFASAVHSSFIAAPGRLIFSRSAVRPSRARCCHLTGILPANTEHCSKFARSAPRTHSFGGREEPLPEVLGRKAQARARSPSGSPNARLDRQVCHAGEPSGSFRTHQRRRRTRVGPRATPRRSPAARAGVIWRRRNSPLFGFAERLIDGCGHLCGLSSPYPTSGQDEHSRALRRPLGAAARP